MRIGNQIYDQSGSYFFTVQVVDWVYREKRNLKVIERFVQIVIIDIFFF